MSGNRLEWLRPLPVVGFLLPQHKNMEKEKSWFKKQSKQSKIIIVASLILHIWFATHQTSSYFLPVYGLGAFLGRLLGQLLGVIVPLLLLSLPISLIPYFIFKRVAEKYKNYLDYFVVVFLIISILIIWLNLSHPIMNKF